MFFQIFVVQIGDVFAFLLRGGVFFAQAAVGFDLFAAAFQIVGKAAQQAGFGGGLDFGGGVVGEGGRGGEGEKQQGEQRDGFFREHGYRAGRVCFFRRPRLADGRNVCAALGRHTLPKGAEAV